MNSIKTKIKKHSKVPFWFGKGRESIQLINHCGDLARYLADCNVTYFHFFGMWVRQLNCYLDMWYSCSATLSAVPCVLSLPLPPPHEFRFSSQFAQGSLPSQVYQGCCATSPCYITKASCIASLVYLRGQAHTNKTYLNMPVIETIEFWKFLKYFNMALLKFGSHGILISQ